MSMADDINSNATVLLNLKLLQEKIQSITARVSGGAVAAIPGKGAFTAAGTMGGLS